MRENDYDDPRRMEMEDDALGVLSSQPPEDKFWFGLLLALAISAAGWVFFAYWLFTWLLC